MKRGYAHRLAMQEASVCSRQWAILVLSGKRLSFRIGLIHFKLLLVTALPLREGTKSGASARELFALLLLALPSVLTVQKLLLLL